MAPRAGKLEPGTIWTGPKGRTLVLACVAAEVLGLAQRDGDQQRQQTFAVNQLGEPAVLHASTETVEGAERPVLFAGSPG
jgi:hypothetical protein